MLDKRQQSEQSVGGSKETGGELMKMFNRPITAPTLNVFGIFLFFLSICHYALASTQPSGVNVSMDYWAPYYRPALAIVPSGASIHIVNPTSSPHTLTHDGCRVGGPCAFDTGAVQPGQEFTIPSLPPGRYPYFCVLHPIMKGEIIVMPHHTVIG
ncbi:MAG: cupredoxin domain-containing protein [Nitrospirales bacterium]|nr:cupredoxin domain-containing protein [Nitrospirales bacterium]